jgi:hypothetical protein
MMPMLPGNPTAFGSPKPEHDLLTRSPPTPFRPLNLLARVLERF